VERGFILHFFILRRGEIVDLGEFNWREEFEPEMEERVETYEHSEPVNPRWFG
jgi:hypothetical protein